ncbi:hypothetical protein K7G98_25125 [Saccharothrix sp. MB29]|nr:hypothetical protein [Saccharothrix sp. MB29]
MVSARAASSANVVPPSSVSTAVASGVRSTWWWMRRSASSARGIGSAGAVRAARSSSARISMADRGWSGLSTAPVSSRVRCVASRSAVVASNSSAA